MDRTATNQGSQNNSKEWGRGKGREEGKKRRRKNAGKEKKNRVGGSCIEEIGIFSNYMMEF